MKKRQQKAQLAKRRAHAARPRKPTGEWLPEADGQFLPLMWRPDYMPSLSRTNGIAHFWPLIQAYTGLENPEDFPAFEWTPSVADRRMLARYVQTCEHLAGSALMNSQAGIKVNWHAVTGKARVVKNLGRPDEIAGYLALFRQLFNPKDEASFVKVRNVIGRAAHEHGADAAQAMLTSWKRAEAALLSTHMDRMKAEVAKKMARGRDPIIASETGHRMWVEEDVTPNELIRAYFYGDALHWGESAERLERWKADPLTDAFMERHMISDAILLGHFYMGFATIVRCGLRGPGAD